MTGLRDARQKAGLTQQELAFRAGVSIRTVQRAEDSRGLDPSIESLRKFARVLGVGIGDLIDDEPKSGAA